MDRGHDVINDEAVNNNDDDDDNGDGDSDQGRKLGAHHQCHRSTHCECF